MLYQIEELLRGDGASPFAEWFDSLEAVAAAKVRVAVGRMEQGNLSGVEWFRGIGEAGSTGAQGYASTLRETA